MNRDPPKGYNKNWLSVILLRFRLPVCQRTFYEYTITSIEIIVTFLKRNVKIRAIFISNQLLVNIFFAFFLPRNFYQMNWPWAMVFRVVNDYRFHLLLSAL